MSVKRLRLFAGPNGSGKTTILKELTNEIPFGVYVNADDIEKILNQTKCLLFDTFQLNVTEKIVQNFLKNSSFSPIKKGDLDLWKKIRVLDNVLYVTCEIDSYIAADIASLIREQLLVQNKSFTFETVMSHDSKIDFIKKAKSLGYRIYLYFSSTEDPLININRVGIRVYQKGHYVENGKIVSRYYKSLRLLKTAIMLSDRAYIWDNSSKAAVLFAEVSEGININILDNENVPNWFHEYVLDNND